MFHKIIEWIRKVFKERATQGEVLSTIVLDDKTIDYIELWSAMYEDKAPWTKDDVTSTGIPSAVSSELARLVTLEMESEIIGSKRADFLNAAYRKVLSELRIQTEYACALGGIILKPYVQGDTISVEFIQADRFVPTGFNSSGQITSCQFVEQVVRNGKIYTRVESHDFDGKYCVIQNRAYESKQKGVLGHQINLTDVPEWENLEEHTTIKNVPGVLFSYFKIPQANNKNRQSPFGVSVYSKAAELIKQADEQWARIMWEFKGTELAVDMSESLFRKDSNGNTILPSGKGRLFRQYSIDAGISEKPFYQIFSPEIRDSSLFNGFNQILRRIEFACGLAYGTLSDVQDEDRTATEVLFSKQRSYSFVSQIQESLQNALEDLIKAMDVWTSLYKLAPAGSYDVSFNFDDSLIVDSKTENQLMMQEATSGLIRKEIYLMRRYGVTEDQAKEMLPETVITPEEE